jgi:putative ABC transport system permease protein
MPDWTSDLRARLAGLRLSPGREASIIDELSQHLEDRRQELIAGGIEPERATELTRTELARADLLTPRLAALRQSHWQSSPPPGVQGRRPFSGFWQDLRYSWRTLRRDPFVAVIAVLTLSFGIGLNTSMFGFMNALLFRPLPFPDSAGLMRLFRTVPENRSGGFSPADYLALTHAEGALAEFAAYQPSNLVPSDAGWSAEWFRVSTNLFDVLGVQPIRGRSFRAEDGIPGNERVVLISAQSWRDHFARAADIVGRTVQANGLAYEVIGVLPPSASDHRLFGRVGLFSPLTLNVAAQAEATTHTLSVLGRRAPPVSEAQAAAFIASMGARMAADFPAGNTDSAWRSEGLPQSNTGQTGRALLSMLLGLSSCVLLIACANLANLLLARAFDRAREFAVRTALGASRLQIIRTVMLESLLLAAGGGVGAVLVATWTTHWLQSVVVDGGGPAVPMDWRVFSFAAGASLSTVLFCGVGPALFARRINTSDALKSGARGATATRGHIRLRNVFVVGQFSLAMILLAGAAFFVRGTTQMMSQRYGWVAERVVQSELLLPGEQYAENSDIIAFQHRLIDRLERIPSVESASVSYGLPYMGLRGTDHYVGDADEGAQTLTTKINGISPAYFDVTGTPMVAGRSFNDTDTATSSRVAIISEGMARRLFPDGSALGRRVASAGSEPRTWMEVVGVVSDVRSIDVAQEPGRYQLYRPTTQDPHRGWLLAVRTVSGTTTAAMSGISSAIAELDPNLSVRRLMTATNRMQEVNASMSLVTRLLTGFAGLGLSLAALGIYGATARMVAQRTDEIGLRIALGAQLRNVFGLVFASGARIVAIGVGIGLVGTFALSRVIGSVLPGMEIGGASAGVAAMGLLTAVALLACYFPARRAARVDPIVALRNE